MQLKEHIFLSCVQVEERILKVAALENDYLLFTVKPLPNIWEELRTLFLREDLAPRSGQ